MVGSIDGLGVNRMPTFSYGPSKAAVHHLTRTLAAHLAARNITVNAIAPGPFPSKMMAHTLETMGEQIKEGVPLKRIGEPGDMAGAAIYLSSKASSYVTGVVIPVDGGITGADSDAVRFRTAKAISLELIYRSVGRYRLDGFDREFAFDRPPH